MRSLILYEPNAEIKKTFHFRKKKQWIEEQRCEARRNLNMVGEKRILRDFVASAVQGITSSIAQPAVDANDFELKPALISMM